MWDIRTADGVLASSLGLVEDVEYTVTYRIHTLAGLEGFSFRISDLTAPHPGFVAGARVALMWSTNLIGWGEIESPDWNTGSFSARGIALNGERWEAVAGTKPTAWATNTDTDLYPTCVPSLAIRALQPRLGWTLPADYPVTLDEDYTSLPDTLNPAMPVQSKPYTVDEVLATWVKRRPLTTVIVLEPNGRLAFRDDPTSPDYRITPTDATWVTLTDDYVTEFHVVYQSGYNSDQTPKSAMTLYRRATDLPPRQGETLDLTDQGVLTRAQALEQARLHMEQLAPALAFAEPVTVNADEVVSLTGAPEALELIPMVCGAGVMVQHDNLRDPTAGYVPGTRNWIVGRATYRDRKVTLTPVGASIQDFASSQRDLASTLAETRRDVRMVGAQATGREVTTSAAGFMSASDKSKLDGIQSGAQVNPNVATTSSNGLMSSTDKTKLDGIASGAQVNPGNATTSVAGLMSSSDKTKLDGIQSGAQVNPGNATTGAAGLMSSADKTKLNGIEAGAQVNPGNATTSTAGLMSSTDKSKLDGVQSGAQVNPGNATTSVAGLMSSTDKTKLDGIGVTTTFAPSFTNFTLGNGTVGVCQYTVLAGGSYLVEVDITLGSTSSMSGSFIMAAPIAANTFSVTLAFLTIAGSTLTPGLVYVSGGAITVNVMNAAGTYLQRTNTGSTTPATWTTGDRIRFVVIYR